MGMRVYWAAANAVIAGERKEGEGEEQVLQTHGCVSAGRGVLFAWLLSVIGVVGDWLFGWDHFILRMGKALRCNAAKRFLR